MSSSRQSDELLPEDETPLLYNPGGLRTAPFSDGQEEDLIPKGRPSHPWMGSFTPPKLLVILGPALLTGYVFCNLPMATQLVTLCLGYLARHSILLSSQITMCA